ncbi:glycosyltransferase family 2 protein [Lacticaseibacillus brantae]|uniref:Glycosyltransferase n=1 Tax=Lacticaseibacillus brantae DSM 23927 TaxID=1423727 RepID=A0A0R2AXN4_9LACO|nr:glycosyltransferase family 2 protein [Lacticaseibacillus brantae]KRM72145.1 glycosyltransferase [Lacticaseibacillus brantae DSM 23927]
MADEPMITVVVPTYNLGQFFKDSAESLLKQDYPNFEVFLIDDASTDGTGKAVDAVAAQDERFHAVHFPKHEGVSVARNYGIDHASGEFVTFVDGDDQVKPAFLRMLVEGFAQGPADVVTVGYTWGRWFESHGAKQGWQAVSKRAMFDAVRARGDEIGGYVWNKAFRVSVLRDKHIRYDESLTLAEDLLFTTEAVVAGDGFWFNPAVLYDKINRPGSTIHSATMAMRQKEQAVRRQMDALGDKI